MEKQQIKHCPKCNQFKLMEEFSFSKPNKKRPNGRYDTYCKSCHNAYEKAWIKANYQKAQQRWKRYWENNHDKILQRAEKHREAIKEAAFAHYGKQCACCGEDTFEFLTIDHIIPPTTKTIYEKKALYGWLKKHQYPEGFQTLCWNCNMAKGMYGVCPHQSRDK